MMNHHDASLCIASDASAIAVVGIGCRFPGQSDGPAAFWRNLLAGRDCIGEVPESRWRIESFYNPLRGTAGKTVTKWGGFIDNIDHFDAAFFGISPREAALMDPQQRILLEVAWEALEDSGIVPATLAGSNTGVFIGGFTLDYMLMQLGGDEYRSVEPHTATGSMMTLLANRLSYAFGMQGPSIALDTACSSSLVAVHLACQSIAAGESDIALVGGVNALLTPRYTIAESRAGMMSPTGRSRAFDSRADGYVRGEGAGIAVLKSLSRAIADGDRIYAVVRGTAVNQDGHSEGITVPSGDAQRALITTACRAAGISTNDICYIEAHGTGTPVGDPIEVNAIGSIVSIGRSEEKPCLISSVKTNIGHTEAAAGVAGLIKTALCLYTGQVPPHLHLIKPNPKIDFDRLKLRVPKEVETLPVYGEMRYAGVNSFGFGGTNAHAVLSEWRSTSSEKSASPFAGVYALPISARHPASLAALAEQYKNRIQAGDATLADICYTAAVRRQQHDIRAVAVGRDTDSIAKALSTLVTGEPHPGLIGGNSIANVVESRALVFVYTGMGPQWFGMGQQLYAAEPRFRASVDQCATVFYDLAGWSILDEMLADETESKMHCTEIAQPANFILQVALTDLLRTAGIKPAAIVGHSAGEPAAAYAAGALTLEDATTVIYHRSRLQQLTAGQGTMVALGLPVEKARKLIAEIDSQSLAIAAINAPSSVTVAGTVEAIERIEQALSGSDIFVRRLKVEVPYHSPVMDVLKEEILSCLAGITPREPVIPLYSTVTGQLVEGSELDAVYWFRNVRQSVEFAQTVMCILEDGYSHFLEIGPHPVLAGSITENAAGAGTAVTVFRSLRREDDEPLSVTTMFAQLHSFGYDIDWAALFGGAGRFVSMPTYAWNRQAYWHEPPYALAARLHAPRHPLLARRIDAPLPTWEVDLESPALDYIADHLIQGMIVYPGAGYIEMATAAVDEYFGDSSTLALVNIQFEKALYLDASEPTVLRITLDSEKLTFTIDSRRYDTLGGWRTHCRGALQTIDSSLPVPVSLDALRDKCNRIATKEECYMHFSTLGLEYGERFQGIQALQQGELQALAQIDVPAVLKASIGDYRIHPAVLDYCLQTMAAALPFASQKESDRVYMPVGLSRLRIFGAPAANMWVHARITALDKRGMTADIRLFDDEGRVILVIEECQARAIGEEANGAQVQRLYRLDWIEQEMYAAASSGNDASALPVREKEFKSAALDTDSRNSAGIWLVIGETSRLTGDLCEALAEKGQMGLRVVPGTSFNTVPGGWLIDVAKIEDWRHVLQSLQEYGNAPLRGIIHAGGTTIAMPESASTDAVALTQATEQSCIALLNAVNALAAFRSHQKAKLWIITRNAQPVPAESKVAPNPLQSMLWGFARVIGHAEYKDLWGGIIDLDATHEADEGRHLVTELLEKNREDQIAYRDGRRYVARLSSIDALFERCPPVVLRPDVSYLITGGLGALGQVVSRWLIARGARHLILVGREGLPNRAQWHEVLADSRIGRRIAAVQELERCGANVRVASFDIADFTALDNFLAAHDAEHRPPIAGVIHAAGIAIPQLIGDMTNENFERVLRPKLHGGWNLHRAFAEKPLDFFILFSSIASVVVMMGQSNYAAGNAFLDALAHFRRANGKSGLAINWGPWGDIGMAADLDLIGFFLERGFHAMSNAQGLDALGKLMTTRSPQAIVLGAEWNRIAGGDSLNTPPMLDMLIAAEAKLSKETSDGECGGTDIGERLQQAADAAEREAVLIQYVRGLVCNVLRIEEGAFSSAAQLSMFGLDSMMAIELKNRIEKNLKVSIPVVELLRGASVASIAAYISPSVEARYAATSDTVLAEIIDAIGNLNQNEIATLLEQTNEPMNK